MSFSRKNNFGFLKKSLIAQGTIESPKTRSIGQGTIEYLMIIAFVVVVALVVSVLLLTQNENAILIGKELDNYPATKSGGIIISDSVLSSTGDAVISLKNDTGKDLNITQFVATSGGSDGNVSLSCNGLLRVGHTKNCLVFDVNTLCPCTGNNTVTCNYKIKYTFSTGIEKEETITIKNTCTSTAPTYTINYTTTQGGTISGTTLQKIISGGNGTPVTAIADEGYEFIDWNDGVITPTRTEYNIVENKSLLANFKLVPNGSIQRPWVITNCLELQAIDNNLDGNFILGNNIDCSDTKNWISSEEYCLDPEYLTQEECEENYSTWYITQTEGFEPIGKLRLYIGFTGTLDGNKKIISNLFIKKTDGPEVGLFESIDGGKIINLGLEDVNIESYAAGVIAGSFSNGGYIKNSYTTGNIYVDSYGGGLIGLSGNIDINNCYSKVNVINSSPSIGSASLGGLVGASSNTKINNSYSVGNITGHPVGDDIVGGLIGTIFPSTNNNFSNSYYAGNIIGDSSSGLVGDKSFTAIVNIENSFWNQSKYTIDYMNDIIGESKVTSQMVHNYNGENTFMDWDFVNVWVNDEGGSVNNGYPYLRWQTE